MTDEELRGLVDTIATSSAKFAAGAIEFGTAARELMQTIVVSQEGAAKAIAVMMRRTGRHNAEVTAAIAGYEKTAGGRLIEGGD
jgi:hypothetical protein